MNNQFMMELMEKTQTVFNPIILKEALQNEIKNINIDSFLKLDLYQLTFFWGSN